tara:strand:+ start:2406 stop:2666 length:261 start_codon:yes stop_codon:yes gene_type:complete
MIATKHVEEFVENWKELQATLKVLDTPAPKFDEKIHGDFGNFAEAGLAEEECLFWRVDVTKKRMLELAAENGFATANEFRIAVNNQ